MAYLPLYAFGVALDPATAAFCASLFLLTSLKPAISITKPSSASTTASVTIAPITPFTAGLSPFPLPEELELLGEADEPLEDESPEYCAQVPVVLPHAVHHCCVSPMANLLIPAEKSAQLSVSWPELKSG